MGDALMKEVHLSEMLLECESFGIQAGLRAFVLSANAQEIFDVMICDHVRRTGIPQKSPLD